MEPGVLRTGGQPCWGFRACKVGLGLGVASRACGLAPTSVLGVVLGPTGWARALGGSWGPWTPSLVGPGNGQPARTAVAGVCSGPFLESSNFLKAWDHPGFTQVYSRALGLLATPGCESLRGRVRVV